MELKKAMTTISVYEFELSRAVLTALKSIPEFMIYGLNDATLLDESVATYSICLKKLHPPVVAEKLAQEGIKYVVGTTIQ